jgi:hypothetical protein
LLTDNIIQLTIPGMSGGRRPSSPAKYIRDLLERTKSARVVSGLTREEVIERLSAQTNQKVDLARYKKWETRTPIPHQFIIPFCEIVSADPWMLLTGSPFRLGKNLQMSETQTLGKRSAA